MTYQEEYECKQKMYEVRRAWRTWIALEAWGWSWFVTLTFASLAHPESANKAWLVFLNELNQTCFGKRYYKNRDIKGVVYARALERQARQAIHIHALIGGVRPQIRRLTFMDYWHEKTGGIARIEAYSSAKGAVKYVSKYVAKEGDLEIGGAVRRVFPELVYGQEVLTLG